MKLQMIEREVINMSNLKVCENCEWMIYKEEYSSCLLTSQGTEIYQCCDRYKQKTGEHITL